MMKPWDENRGAFSFELRSAACIFAAGFIGGYWHPADATLL